MICVVLLYSPIISVILCINSNKLRMSAFTCLVLHICLMYSHGTLKLKNLELFGQIACSRNLLKDGAAKDLLATRLLRIDG